MNRSLLWLGLIACGIACACAPLTPPTNTSGLRAVTPFPTLDTSNPEALCSMVEATWDSDWPTAIRALEALRDLSHDCGETEPTTARLYASYIGYGKLLGGSGQADNAAEAYRAALVLRPDGSEAIDGLVRLEVISPTPAPSCDGEQVRAALAAVPRYRASSGTFVKVAGAGFVVEGRPYPVYGVNYYPRDTPWRRFLSETDTADLDAEFELLTQAGLNVLRIQVRHDLLFECKGSGAVPIPENVDRLDDIVQTAARYGLRLIVVLNDAPDFSTYPLYTTRQSLDEMIYLAGRYRNEPAILAWDLRDSGDQDYLVGRVEKRSVLIWLADAAPAIREADPNHLLTASWGTEAAATIPSVDFVSFEPPNDLDGLRQQIAVLTAATDKPIVMSSIGYPTFGRSEESQRDALQAALDAARNNGLAGWAVWTAFDFPLTVTCYEPGCVNQDSADHHYGLWRTDYAPKLAVAVIRLATGVQQ